MSLDKKAILKEIEVLIRSIKVHYDNIENEYRIPTIELELITSKIRKLHEKSIIYNHLHYQEEEHLQSSRRLKMDNLIFKHISDVPLNESQIIEPEKNELFTTHLKFEEKISVVEKTFETAVAPQDDASADKITLEETKIEELIIVEDIKIVEEINTIDRQKSIEETRHVETTISIEVPKDETPISIEVPIIEPINNEHFKQVKISSKIGINDRFRFIKNLFGGNGAEMEEHITAIENCSNAQALQSKISSIKAKYNWNEEDENVIDFMVLLG